LLEFKAPLDPFLPLLLPQLVRNSKAPKSYKS